MSDLEQLGIAGPNYLRETLTNCSDPLKAMEEFQEQNSILLPSLKPALHFLDLHSIPRTDFHVSGKILAFLTLTDLGSEATNSKTSPHI